ncbi:UNVERIFIED_CONTAM: hypothetical protein K2H54_051489 [Gekko kuhli]
MEEGEEGKKRKEVKMATIRLEIFPTAVTEEKLQEAREKSLRRIFGTTQTLRRIKSPRKWGTLGNILQERVERAVELYEQKAEAFLQLCDFQSAALHLRKAYGMTLAKDECLARLAFILYLQGQSLYEQQVYLDALESFTRASELQPQKTLYHRRR